MSIANLKIIFVKKQKQTRERPTQGEGGGVGAFIITEMAVFTLAMDYLCEMGYPFDDSRQIGNRRGSTPVSTVLRKSVRVFIKN